MAEDDDGGEGAGEDASVGRIGAYLDGGVHHAGFEDNFGPARLALPERLADL